MKRFIPFAIFVTIALFITFADSHTVKAALGLSVMGAGICGVLWLIINLFREDSVRRPIGLLLLGVAGWTILWVWQEAEKTL